MTIFIFPVLIVLLPVVVSQDTCSVSYNRERSRINLELDWELARGSPGRPGKRGPPGPTGNKGEKGPVNDLEFAVLDKMEKVIRRHELRIEKLEGKWTTAPNNYEYRLSENTYNWTDATVYCEDREAKLATVGMRDRTIIQFLMDNNVMQNLPSWVGLNDREVEGEWVWNDGILSNAENTFWRPEEPNNYKSNENCAGIYSSGTMNDINCSYKYHALCELDPGQ